MKKWHMEGIMNVADNAPRKVVFAGRHHIYFEERYRYRRSRLQVFLRSIFKTCVNFVFRLK